MRPSSREDAGGIVIGFLLKIALTLVVVGVVCFDLVSVGVSRVALEDQAATAARSAATQWRDSHNLQAAIDAAQVTAAEADPGNLVEPNSFAVDADGSVSLSVSRTARTFVAHHVPQLRDWIRLDAIGKAAPPS